jgi:hypothetical protein
LAAKTAVYAHEQERTPELGEEFEQQFQADLAAWEFFQARPPWFRKAAVW